MPSKNYLFKDRQVQSNRIEITDNLLQNYKNLKYRKLLAHTRFILTTPSRFLNCYRSHIRSPQSPQQLLQIYRGGCPG